MAIVHSSFVSFTFGFAATIWMWLWKMTQTHIGAERGAWIKEQTTSESMGIVYLFHRIHCMRFVLGRHTSRCFFNFQASVVKCHVSVDAWCGGMSSCEMMIHSSGRFNANNVRLNVKLNVRWCTIGAASETKFNSNYFWVSPRWNNGFITIFHTFLIICVPYTRSGTSQLKSNDAMPYVLLQRVRYLVRGAR